MKNFFMVSGALYTLAIALAISTTIIWPVAVDPNAPPMPQNEGLIFLAVIVLIGAALSSYVFGLWDNYQSKHKK